MSPTRLLFEGPDIHAVLAQVRGEYGTDVRIVAADKIRSGKVAAAGALIGAVMKEMRGQADAARVRELIIERLT